MQSRCIPYANIGIKKDSASYLPRNRLKTVTSHKKKDCRHAIFRHIDSPSLFVIFRESGLFWPKPPISGFLDIIHNPLPDFRRSVTLPAFHLDFRRTHIGIQRSIHSLAYQCAFFLQIKVLELNPAHEEARIGLVLLNEKDNRPREAMEQINAMVAAAPDHAILYAVRAGLEQTRKQYEAAEADFTKAISLEPKNIDYLLNRAALYIETKRKKEARADLDKAMELGANPEDVASMRHELR